MKAPGSGVWARVSQGILLNPIWLSEHHLRVHVRRATQSLAFAPSDRWLDVGCGLRPYESYFPAGSYVGVDVEVSGRDPAMKTPDCYYDGRLLPFADRSFDGAFSTQVLEHVADPAALLREMHRVVKPGGSLLLSLPFVWQEHEEPFDFFRFTRFGITEMLKQTGFTVVEIQRDSGTLETLAVMLNLFVLDNLIPPIRGVGRLVAALVCCPIQIVALIAGRLAPETGKLYLNLVVRATRLPSAQER